MKWQKAFKLIIFLSVSSINILMASCTTSKFKYEEEILSSINEIPYEQIKPIIYFPDISVSKLEPRRENYTAEALDAAGYIVAQSVQLENGQILSSEIINVRQEINSNSAEITTLWHLNNLPENITISKTFTYTHFKPIKPNHEHYIHSNSKLEIKEALLKYN